LSAHAHFEELCVLATSGQLSAAESDILNQHLVECDSCRSFLKDAHFISDRIIPQALPVSRNDRPVPDGIRERFLARAVSKGLRIQAGPLLAAIAPAEVPETQHPVRPRQLAWLKAVPSLSSWQLRALAGTACVACFVLGLLTRTPFGTTKHGDSVATVQQNPVQPQASSAPPASGNADKVRALTAERDQLSQQIADLAGQLQSIQKEKQQTQAVLQQQAATAQSNAERDHDTLAQQVAALSARTADLQSQLDAAREQQSLADADLRNARAKSMEYSARMDLLQAQLRNQEATALPDPDEVSSLVAARNLHIIDVYDASGGGKRQRAFGRVFYVEGRSLVFYAYDLTGLQVQKNVTFHLWGEKVGSRETTLSLGILHNEDPKERRWALTCNDPNLLAKINSVYVTVDPAGRQRDTPHGERVLYAYFGAQPNHP
jgi:hypothetical protein